MGVGKLTFDNYRKNQILIIKNSVTKVTLFLFIKQQNTIHLTYSTIQKIRILKTVEKVELCYQIILLLVFKRNH